MLPVSWGGESKPSSNEGGAGWATYIRLARLALSAPLSYCPRAVPSHFKRAAALSKLVREARPGLAHFSESEWREVTLADIVLGLHRSGGVSAAAVALLHRGRRVRADTASATHQRLFHNLRCWSFFIRGIHRHNHGLFFTQLCRNWLIDNYNIQYTAFGLFIHHRQEYFY